MSAESIVGRALEQERLQEILTSGEAELIALYGRRRVGKTFLIREFFSGHTFVEVAGEKGQSAKLQIARKRSGSGFAPPRISWTLRTAS